MKNHFIAVAVIAIILTSISCSEKQPDQAKQLQQQINDLKEKMYVPGLGEFMNTIQLHHAKLWFEGLDQNWPLAKYETDEMKETFQDIQKYVTDRPEAKFVPMINPGIDSVKNAIAAKDLSRFKAAYVTLTNACNNCHYATNHAYNVITIPHTLPVTDQQLGEGKNQEIGKSY